MRSAAAIVLLLASGLVGQDEPPMGVVHGILLERDAAVIRVRTADQGVLRFYVDRRTFLERDRRAVALDKLEAGDAVEVMWKGEGGDARFASMIRVTAFQHEARPKVTYKMLTPYGSPSDALFPRGRLTFSGVVLRIANNRMVLRTRAEGEKTFVLRRDTLYKQSGTLAERSSLQTGLRVFLRGGMSLDDELEAYEIVWGEILAPEK